MLLSIAKKLALEAGISKLYLNVNPYDLPSTTSRAEVLEPTVRFYQKNGFVPDRMFCLEKTMSSSYFGRMVCYIQPDAPHESSVSPEQTHMSASSESSEIALIAKVAIAYAVVVVCAIWALNR